MASSARAASPTDATSEEAVPTRRMLHYHHRPGEGKGRASKGGWAEGDNLVGEILEEAPRRPPPAHNVTLLVTCRGYYIHSTKVNAGDDSVRGGTACVLTSICESCVGAR